FNFYDPQWAKVDAGGFFNVSYIVESFLLPISFFMHIACLMTTPERAMRIVRELRGQAGASRDVGAKSQKASMETCHTRHEACAAGPELVLGQNVGQSSQVWWSGRSIRLWQCSNIPSACTALERGDFHFA
ncbi:ML2, partial [Symbiodinium necroappetens]